MASTGPDSDAKDGSYCSYAIASPQRDATPVLSASTGKVTIVGVWDRSGQHYCLGRYAQQGESCVEEVRGGAEVKEVLGRTAFATIAPGDPFLLHTFEKMPNSGPTDSDQWRDHAPRLLRLAGNAQPGARYR